MGTALTEENVMNGRTHALLLAPLLVLLAAGTAMAQTCPGGELKDGRSGLLDPTTYRAPETTADWRANVASSSGFRIQLKRKGQILDGPAGTTSSSTFVVTAQDVKRDAATNAPRSGTGTDYNGDGWVDIINEIHDDCTFRYLRNQSAATGGVGTQNVTFAGGDTPPLAYWETAAGSPLTALKPDNTAGSRFNFRCDPEGQNSPALFSGDFDGDSKADLLFFTVSNQSDFTRSNVVSHAFAFRFKTFGRPAAPTSPIFYPPTDLKDTFTAVNWHWTANVGQVIDWDKDGKDDLLLVSSWTDARPHA